MPVSRFMRTLKTGMRASGANDEITRIVPGEPSEGVSTGTDNDRMKRVDLPQRRSGIKDAITRALAPPHMPIVELPAERAEELDELYNALMMPLTEYIPSQKERVAKLMREDTSTEAFFNQRERTTESYAYLIRCLGVQGRLDQAHTAFEQMLQEGLRPDNNSFCALVDACARTGDIDSAEAVVKRMQRAGLPLTAPLFTGLIQAHRSANMPAADWSNQLLTRMRRAGVPEDAPLHTAIICAFVSERELQAARRAYHHMRERSIRPDAVTFTALMMACAYDDSLEQASLRRHARTSRTSRGPADWSCLGCVWFVRSEVSDVPSTCVCETHSV